MFSTWRTSRNQTTVLQQANDKTNIEESLRDDYAFPLPLADKDATLKESEIAENKAITVILQCIEEEQPHKAAQNGKLDVSKKALKHDVKPGVQNSCSVSKGHNDKLANVHTNSIPISKENSTTTYSIPADYRWNDKTHKQNGFSLNSKVTANQKHTSPIYIEISTAAENHYETNLYSIPTDSINDSEKTAGNNKYASTDTRDQQVVETATNVPLTTDSMRSDCKPQGIASSLHSVTKNEENIYCALDDDDDDDDDFITTGYDERVYSSPINSPMPWSGTNPSYKRVQANNSCVHTEYTDPVANVSRMDIHSNSVQSLNKHKHNPVKPNPYKPKGASTSPHTENLPLYEEMFQTASTLPCNNNGIHHNMLPAHGMSLDTAKTTANSQELLYPIGMDDYTIPNTGKIKIQKNPSYGDVCNSTDEISDYSYITTNRLTTPSVIKDACTTHTEC